MIALKQQFISTEQKEKALTKKLSLFEAKNKLLVDMSLVLPPSLVDLFPVFEDILTTKYGKAKKLFISFHPTFKFLKQAHSLCAEVKKFIDQFLNFVAPKISSSQQHAMWLYASLDQDIARVGFIDHKEVVGHTNAIINCHKYTLHMQVTLSNLQFSITKEKGQFKELLK